MMHAINNNLWDHFCKSPTGYYVKCGIADKAMGLWILHFKDYVNVFIKSENVNEEHSSPNDGNDGKIKKRKQESHFKRLRGHSSMSVNSTLCTRKNLETFHL